MTGFDRAVAEVDLGAIDRNLSAVRERVGAAEIMAVVKADAYGHGAVPVARQARASGVTWLGVALPSEATALRAAGDSGRILAWLWTPGDPHVADCVRGGVDLSASSSWACEEILEAARSTGSVARVQVKVDTGLSRNGVPMSQLPELLDRLADAVADGSATFEGLWSHLANGDVPGSASVVEQRDVFNQAREVARSLGLEPARLHMANSGAVFAHPECHLDLVRVGIAMYGLTPDPGLGSARDLGLTPAMTLLARLAHVKDVEPGTKVSYGSTWTAAAATTLGLVPLGYADGIPRAASSRAHALVGARQVPVVGRVAMDQFVVDLGSDVPSAAGDVVRVFGPGESGEPTADDWGVAAGTIGYEIVTRIGGRVPRRYVDHDGAGWGS